MQLHKEIVDNKLVLIAPYERKEVLIPDTDKPFNFTTSGTRTNFGWQSVSNTKNRLNGGANAYEVGQNRQTGVTWTYTNTIPATRYTFHIWSDGQGNGYLNQPTVKVTYNDSTEETVFYYNWGGVSFDNAFTFEAVKPIKSISMTCYLTHSSVTYVGINLHMECISQTEKAHYILRDTIYALDR